MFGRKHWNRALLALSSAITLLVLGVVTASATNAGALRAAGSHAAALASSTTPVRADAAGGSVSSGGLGPVQISIGNTWTLDGNLLVRGTVTITCGPFSTTNPGTVQVLVEEPVNDKVAHASGQIASVPCDGAAHRNTVTALVADVPFRAADGATQVDASACGIDPTTFQFICQPGHAVAKVRIQ